MTSNLIINDIQTKKIIDQYKNYYEIVHINKGYYIFVCVFNLIYIIYLVVVIIAICYILSKITKNMSFSSICNKILTYFELIKDINQNLDDNNQLELIKDGKDYKLIQKIKFIRTKLINTNTFNNIQLKFKSFIKLQIKEVLYSIIPCILNIILLFTKNNRDIYLDKNLTNNNVKYKVYINKYYIYISKILFILSMLDKINSNILSILDFIMGVLEIIFIYQSQDKELKHKYETNSKDSKNIFKIEIINDKQFRLKKKINGNEVAEIINIK